LRMCICPAIVIVWCCVIIAETCDFFFRGVVGGRHFHSFIDANLYSNNFR
jgi:hypothetical protein